MPIVLSRSSSSRPPDAALLRMRDQAEAHYRANRRKPFPPKPRSEAGYSTPEWNVARACWLVYALDDTTKWMAWDKLGKRWISIQDYDRFCAPSKDQSKVEMTNRELADIETAEALTASVPQRSKSDPLPETRSRFTLKGVAGLIMKVLALQRGNSDPER